MTADQFIAEVNKLFTCEAARDMAVYRAVLNDYVAAFVDRISRDMNLSELERMKVLAGAMATRAMYWEEHVKKLAMLQPGPGIVVLLPEGGRLHP